jgi:hypothetical protein
MGFLKKIRGSILNQRNSFHIGFRNRSPFSYKGKYVGDWTPEVPDIVIPKPTSQIPVLDAEIALVGKVADAATKVAKAAIEHKVDDPNKKSKRLEKRAQRIGDRADKALNKDNIKRGERLAQKSEDILMKSVEAFNEEPTAELNCVLNGGSWEDGKCV